MLRGPSPGYAPQLWTPADHVRHWQLLRWVDQPLRPHEAGGGNNSIGQARCLPRQRPDIFYLFLAREAGARPTLTVWSNCSASATHESTATTISKTSAR